MTRDEAIREARRLHEQAMALALEEPPTEALALGAQVMRLAEEYALTGGEVREQRMPIRAPEVSDVRGI